MIGYWFYRLAWWVLVLIQPVGLVWSALLIFTLALLWKRRWRSATASASLAAFILLIGGTDFASWLLGSLERTHASVPLEQLPVCDAIVQLGGSAEPSAREAGRIHLTFAGDRLLMALELARLGKAPVLCLGGGFAPQEATLGHEADVVKSAIIERGLAPGEVISLGGSLDTHHEAQHIQKLARERGWQRVLLVTSASHLRRAVATFRHLGIAVVPVPCNFLTNPGAPSRQRSVRLPTWHGFFLIAVWLHEEIGWLEYQRRGWIVPADMHE